MYQKASRKSQKLPNYENSSKNLPCVPICHNYLYFYLQIFHNFIYIQNLHLSDPKVNLALIQVTSDGLSGIEAEGSIVTNTDGGLFYTPLTGDMLSTIHDTAQVRLFINDVPTKCSGDCSFQWSSGVTPGVTGVSPTSGKRTYKNNSQRKSVSDRFTEQKLEY